MSSINANLQEMKALRDSAGVRSVLIYLNERTSHRFTAMFRFVGPKLNSVCFYDRDCPEIESCQETPISASYCVFVRDMGQTFTTIDSLSDQRVSSHPKRLEIRSYVGVPLIDVSGDMFGTICHFDTLPCSIDDRSVELMEALGSILDPSRRGLSLALQGAGLEP